MSDLLDRLKTALADRYTIERELGSGGMAVVYLARDVRHDRDVAVKVLRPELAAAMGAERFLREIKLTAKLSHPHILPLLDSGEAEAFLYYVMPYVPGESVRQRLEREIQVPIAEALRISEQVAFALDFAHRQGVIHRDIKPENILLHEGVAMVADFGIALAVSAAGGERLTETGVSIGTVEYMSPEQATGEGEPDARSDIYSLGCVLYEMLVGEPPYTGPTAIAVLTKRLSDPVPSARRLRAAIPRSVDAALMRALAQEPVDRFGSAPEFADALVEPEEAAEPEAPKSIVVLPFENLSPDPENEYFADGLTEELIAELSSIRALRVISRTTAMKLKGSDKDVGAIGRELNVRYVLEGSVRRLGNALRITAQLIDASSDAHLWAERYSGTMDDVFDIQERVARKIVDHLRISLSPEEDRRISQRPINDLVAYDCYLRAKQEIPRWTEGAIDKAIGLLEKAVTIEGPNEALFATLGFAYLSYFFPLPLRDDESLLETANAYATKVFELSPDSAAGHALRGLILFLQGQVEEAAGYLKEAYRQDPNNGDALFGLVITTAWAGHLDAARSYHDQLTVVNPWSGSNPCWVDFYGGQFDAAIDGYRKEYLVDPNSPYTRWAYGCVLVWAGRTDEGLEIVDQIARDTPQTVFGKFATVFSRALRGDVVGALGAVTPELVAAAKPHWQMRWMMSSIYALLGRDTEALDWLELAVDSGFFNHRFLEREPFLKRLQGNPRFNAIMDGAKRRSEAFEP